MTRIYYTSKFNIILNILAERGLGLALTASQIEESANQKYDMDWSLRSIQRYLVEMEQDYHLINKHGLKNKNTYTVNEHGRLLLEPLERLIEDKRLERITKGSFEFNFDLLEFLATHTNPEEFLFYEEALEGFETLTNQYRAKTKNNPQVKRELERMIVEFSWKSSQIEGNTYSLLETEELLNGNLNFPNHTTSETTMILNHKAAFDYIRINRDIYCQDLTPTMIIDLHLIITKNLNIDTGFRQHGVGIAGSLYKPLDNIYQIQDAVALMCKVINKFQNPYMKAMFLGLVIAYIQPFSDGNKRTSRIITNAILYAYDLPLLPFRSVNVLDYKKAVICFYEYNSIELYKGLFIDQLNYCVEKYF